MEVSHLTSLNPMSVAVLFGILLGVLIIFLFVIKKIYKSNILLLLIIVVLLMALLDSLLIRTGYALNTLYLVNIATPFIFLLGPFLYAYTSQQLAKNYSTKAIVLHSIPFLLYLFYSFNFYLQPAAFKYNALVNSYYPSLMLKPFIKTFSEDPWNIQGWVVVELITLHLILYSILSFSLIFKHKNGSPKKIDTLTKRWTIFLNVALLFSALILFFSQGGIVNGITFLASPFPSYSADLAIVLFMYLLTGFIAANLNMFRSHSSKYLNSSLSSSFKNAKMAKLNTIMESEKLYLLNSISLEVLSQKSGITKHHISQILNELLNVSFYEWINKYRIEEAKRLLKSKKYIKIEQLAYQLGYKSKTSFYKAFKKETALTPSKFQSLQSE